MAAATSDMRIPAKRHAGGVNSWLIVAIAALAAALIGLAAWVVVDQTSAAKSDAATLLDRNLAAINASDPAAATATYAEDATINIFGEVSAGRPAIRKSLVEVTGVRTHIERVSDVIVNGDVAIAITAWTNDLGVEGTNLSVLELGDGLIQRQWELDLGTWPPSGLGE